MLELGVIQSPPPYRGMEVKGALTLVVTGSPALSLSLLHTYLLLNVDLSITYGTPTPGPNEWCTNISNIAGRQTKKHTLLDPKIEI